VGGGQVNHFGRLAARVALPAVRQPGPALRSNSPIAEHDQRLASFDVGASTGLPRGAAPDPDGPTVAEVEVSAPIGSVGDGSVGEAQAVGSAAETAPLSSLGARARPSPTAARTEPASQPAARSLVGPAPASPRAAEVGAPEGAGPRGRGGASEARVSAAAAPAGPPQAVAALASALARVEAWMKTPAAPGPARAAADSPADWIPEGSAGIVAAVTPNRALPPPRALTPASASPVIELQPHGDARHGDPRSASAAAGPVPGPRLQIGQISVQVLPAPAPPIARNPAARPERWAAFPSDGSRRLGSAARLGFGMRHW